MNCVSSTVLIVETSYPAYLAQVYVHIKYLANMTYIFKVTVIFFFPLLSRMPMWLVIEPSYLIQICICTGSKNTKRTRQL